MDLRVIVSVLCIFNLVMFVSLYLTCRYYDGRLQAAEENLLSLHRRLEQFERKQRVREDPDIVQQGWEETRADTALSEVGREIIEKDGDSLTFLTKLGETRGPHVRSKRKASDNQNKEGRRNKRNNKKKNKKCGRSKRKCPEKGQNQEAPAEEIRRHSRRDVQSLQGLPQFYLKGGSSQPSYESAFLWDRGNGSYDRDIPTDNFVATTYGRTRNTIQGMKFKYTGLYYVFVQITVAGRTLSQRPYIINDPVVGFTVKKNTYGHWEDLGSTLLTQERSGIPENGNYPVDSMTFSGLFEMDRDSELSVEKITLHNGDIRYNPSFSHFGVFMLSRSTDQAK